MIFEWWMCYIWGHLWLSLTAVGTSLLLLSLPSRFCLIGPTLPPPNFTLPLLRCPCLSFDHCVHTSSMSLARCTVSLSLDGPALITEHVLLPFTLFKLVWRMVWKRLLGFRKMSQVKKLPISCIVFEKIISKKDLNTSKVLLLAPDQRVISGFQIRKVDLEQPIDHL